jgi:hypothetical protein
MAHPIKKWRDPRKLIPLSMTHGHHTTARRQLNKKLWKKETRQNKKDEVRNWEQEYS